MKDVLRISAAMIVMVIAIVACSTDNDWDDYTYPIDNGTPSGGTTDGSSSADNSSELLSFTVAIDKTTAEPTSAATAVYPDEEDDISNNSFGTEMNITFNGSSVSYDDVSGVTVSTDGAHITVDHGSTKGICYKVSGTTTAGSLTVVGDKKYELALNGASITNPDSTAINLLSKKRAYIVLSGTNTLTDGTSSKDDDQKAAFYCKGKMLFSGSGTLSVYGNTKNGIHCADYIVFSKGNNIYVNSTANHGIKANDGIYINGGILNVEVSAAAAKGINCESDIVVSGGRTTVITTGNGAWDSDDNEAKGAAGIKADSSLTVYDGTLCLKSTGTGGKGIKVGEDAVFNGGTIRIITEGGQYKSNNDTASPKGIKVDGNLTIKDGDFMVRTSGYNGEGIESKSVLTVEGGSIMVSAYDDAVNSSSDMYIKGGSLWVCGRNSDGLDANGNMYISGGNIVAGGAGGAETGIDVDESHKLTITGGTLFGIGGRIDANFGTCSQAFAVTTGSIAANAAISISNNSSTLGTLTMLPYSYNNGTILVSAPGMTSSGSYTLTIGSSSQSISGITSYGSANTGNGQPGDRRGW